MDGSYAPGASSSRSFEEPWGGPRKIVIGIDIGTTQTGVAYAYLQPGIKPEVHRVFDWPDQGAGNASKIPTALCYDADNKAVAFGPSVLTPEVEAAIEDDGWHKVELFKLHLHPRHLRTEHGLEVGALPSGVTIDQVYSDFLGYLLQHTKSYFEDHMITGKLLWKTYQPTMDVIIAHPNRWSIEQQAFLRSAAVRAGFAEANNAGDRVHFLNEAEASVHFCAQYTNIATHFKPRTTFAVCDAGGSTVDTTVYQVESLKPIRLKEVQPPGCVQAGAIFVDRAAGTYLNQMLSKAQVPSANIKEFTERGVKDFELNVKRAFHETNKVRSIGVAFTNYDDSDIPAKRGRISLPGEVVRTFFDCCVDQILSNVSSQLEGLSPSHLLLVGGFGESRYLLEQLKARFEPECEVTSTKNQNASKSVADGTIIWYCSNSVVKRVPWCSYGIEVLVPHNPKELAHRRRKTVAWPSGLYSKGGWSQIITKGIQVDCDTITRRPYFREYSTPNPNLNNFKEDIWACTLVGVPEWMRFKPGSLMPGFTPACVVNANLNNLRGALQAHKSPSGTTYWSLSFSVCIRFGRTEYRAYLEWTENGETRTSPAELIAA